LLDFSVYIFFKEKNKREEEKKVKLTEKTMGKVKRVKKRGQKS